MNEITISVLPWWGRFLLGMAGATLVKFLEIYHEGKLSSIEIRLKKNPALSKKTSYFLEIVYVVVGGLVAIQIGNTIINSFVSGIGWEVIFKHLKRGVRR